MLMASNSKHRQLGINLIELIIGIAISLVILTGVLSVILRVNVAGGESVQATRLNQQMRGALDLMSKDLQRAGYVNWSGVNAWEWNDDGPVTNPHTGDDDAGTPVYNILDFYDAAVPSINAFGRVQLFAFATAGDATSGAAACSTNCDCILYSYDIDGDGSLNSGDFELFGFRWNDDAVEMRTAGNVHDCTSGTWQDITDSSVQVTALGFTLQYANNTAGDATVYPIDNEGNWDGTLNTACAPGAGAITDNKCLWRRKVAINLAGQVASDATVTMTLNTDVKIKNDYFQTAP